MTSPPAALCSSATTASDGIPSTPAISATRFSSSSRTCSPSNGTQQYSSYPQHGRSRNRAVLYGLQGFVRLLQRERLHVGLDACFRGQLQTSPHIFARAVRDAPHDALLVQQPIVHLRDGAHRDSRQGQRSAFAQRS